MSAALRSFETQWRARTPDALQPMRDQAVQRFVKLGLPSLRDETWRYTDLRSLAAQDYGEAGCAAAGVSAGSVSGNAALSLVDAGQHAATVTMINACPPLNADFPVINGIEINSISELYKQDPSYLRRFFEAAS